MAKWLKDGEVLVGQGSGETSTCTPRQRGGALSGSPWQAGGGRSPRASPSTRDGAGMVQPETMGKAREMFVLCDKEGKGFITKRDMQRLQRELPLSPEQLESVFESLDRENNGFLTPIEFNMGLGDLMGSDENPEQSQVEAQEVEEQTDWDQDPGGLRFSQTLTELGADKLFKDQRELCSLWGELQRERPDLLGVLEQVLAQAVAHLQDSLRERDSLEQALSRRESEHDQVVQSIYEEMESQIGEERQKRLAQDSIKQLDRMQQLQEELKARELELDSSLFKQKELEKRIQLLSGEQAEMKEQSRQLQGLNLQLQEQLENSREDLQSALAQLNLIQSHSTQEHITRQSNVLKVSKNMQTEKESLLRQLEMLRDMNKRLRDEKDAHQSQKRTPNIRHHLQKKGSIIGNYLLQDKTLKRQLSSNQLEGDIDEKSNTSKRRQTANKGKLDNDKRTDAIQTGVISPQRVFKVVFLGNSGVGKSSFIQHYCTGHFPNAMSTTVGIDFQMRCVTLGFATIVLQLWDTAGQERFRSITQQYYRKADGILTMYDVTSSPSFTAARCWMECLQEKTSDGAVLMLLGNKLDVADSQMREVTTKQGQRLAEQYEAAFYECSAKTGYNIEDLMTQLARLLSAKQDQQCGTVMAVGVWTIMEKSDYISLLHSSYYSASAYILIAAGAIVVVTGILGCCATLKEMRSLLIIYFILLLCVFLLEIAAGVLAYINYQECFPYCYQLDETLKANLKETMVHKYQQPGEESITQAVDSLQQEFKCCGSNSSTDWSDSAWIQATGNSRLVPDSCCKTPSDFCGRRDHPSNIYRVEGGCIMKLEDFILSQLHIIGAVGIGIAFLQLVGMMFTCCLYRNFKEEPI